MKKIVTFIALVTFAINTNASVISDPKCKKNCKNECKKEETNCKKEEKKCCSKK